MSGKMIFWLLLIAVAVPLIVMSVHSAKETEQAVMADVSSDNQDELFETTPLETFRLTVKDTMPEIKMLSCLLGVIFLVAVFSARVQVASVFLQDVMNRSFESMRSRRGEKLAAFEKQKRLQEEIRVRDTDALDLLLAQMEQRVKKNKR